YMSYFAPALAPTRVLWSAATPLGHWTVSPAQIVAIGAIAALAWVNYIGVRSGNLVNIVLTIAKVSGLTALVVFALLYARGGPARVAACGAADCASACGVRRRDDLCAVGERRLVLRHLDRG